LAEELRFQVPDSMRYICQSEAVANYLQKHIVYRKRKISFGEKTVADMLPLFKKFPDEKYLLPCSDVMGDDIPNILNKYKGLAFRQLEQVGLKIGDTIYEPNIQRDAVLRMQINGRSVQPGDQVMRFSVVDLVIGLGPKRDVVVPNLVGITVEEAEQLIKKSLFEIGVVQYDGGNTDPSAIVYYQDPANGSRRDQGMQIDLWASKKLPAEMRNKIRELDRIYRRNMAEPESQQLEENLNNAEQQPE